MRCGIYKGKHKVKVYPVSPEEGYIVEFDKSSTSFTTTDIEDVKFEDEDEE